MKPALPNRFYWLYYVTAAVWFFLAAVALHNKHVAHAIFSLGLALFYLVVGGSWHRKPLPESQTIT